jgi:hypothetical protein
MGRGAGLRPAPFVSKRGFREMKQGLYDGRAAPVLPVGYVVSANRIADRRMILAGYRLADLLTRVKL